MAQETNRKYDLEERLIAFAATVIGVVDRLDDTKAGNHVGNQLVRSGTSPAANYGEAQGAESRKDFIHKMRLALKELRETKVWLQIIRRKELAKPIAAIEAVIRENNELIAIFVTSVATASKRQ